MSPPWPCTKTLFLYFLCTQLKCDVYAFCNILILTYFDFESKGLKPSAWWMASNGLGGQGGMVVTLAVLFGQYRWIATATRDDRTIPMISIFFACFIRAISSCDCSYKWNQIYNLLPSCLNCKLTSV